jgi:hypothetical protein
MRLIHVAPVADERWVVTLDDDGQPPISEHRSRGEAETAARACAETFDYPEVLVHHADGEETLIPLYDVPEPPIYPG